MLQCLILRMGVLYGSAFVGHICPGIWNSIATHLPLGVWWPSLISHALKLWAYAPPCLAASTIVSPFFHISSDLSLAAWASSAVDLPPVQWSRMSPAFISISILSLKPSMHCTALAFDSDVELICSIFPVMHPLRASNAPRRRFDCLQGSYP